MEYSFTLVEKLVGAFALASYTETDLKKLINYENKEQLADLIYGCAELFTTRRIKIVSEIVLIPENVGQWFKKYSEPNLSSQKITLGKKFINQFEIDEKTFSDEIKISNFKILRPLTHAEIIAEVGENRIKTKLADIMFLLKNKKLSSEEGILNIFFVEDKNGVLRILYCAWMTDCPFGPVWYLDVLESESIGKIKVSVNHQFYYRN